MKRKKRLLGVVLMLLLVITAFTYTAKSPVQAFLTSLDEEQLEKVQKPFENGSRQLWHFLPGQMWPRAGIMLKDLNKTQKELAFDMLRDHVSESGFKKIMGIVNLENILRDLGGDKKVRDPEKYFIAIYGDPLEDKLWAWSFEGHHLSFNFTVSGNVVNMTPRFMGANPAVVPSGKYEGMRTLAEEDDMGIELINSLDSSQREIAIFSTEPYYEIVTSNATEVGPLTKVGIKMSELSKNQQKLLNDLIMEHLSAMPKDLAAKRLEKIKMEESKEIRFGWAGATTLGQGHYYRIQGKSFLIEFDNAVNGANHIHTVWRDFDGDFGKDLIREHYMQSSYM